MRRSIPLIVIVFALACPLNGCKDKPNTRAQQLADTYATQLTTGHTNLKNIGRVQLDSARIDFSFLNATQEKLAQLRSLTQENQKVYAELQEPQYSEMAFNLLKKRLWDTGTQVEEMQKALYKEEASYNGRIKGWMSLHRWRIIEADGYIRSFRHVLYFDSAVTRIVGIIDLNDSIPIFRQIE